MKSINWLGLSFLIMVLEAVGVLLAWNYGAVPVFEVNKMEIGHAFALLIGIRIIFRHLYGINGLNTKLDEVAGLLHFSEQNSALKFNAIADLLERVAHKNSVKPDEKPKE